MATNFADLLRILQQQGPRDQANSFAPRVASSLGRGPSPLGRAFLEGTALAAQSLSRNIAPATGEEGIPKFGPFAPSSPNEEDPGNDPTNQPDSLPGTPANFGALAAAGGLFGSFPGLVSVAARGIMDPSKSFADMFNTGFLNDVVDSIFGTNFGLDEHGEGFGSGSVSDVGQGGPGGPGGTGSADEDDTMGGGFGFSDSGQGGPGGPGGSGSADEDDTGGTNDNGSDSDDEGGGACIISTALTAMGDWDRRKKLKAVRWCRDKHHDGSMRGAIWVDGYHCWGARFVHLMKKYPWFKRFGLRISTAYLNQITGEKKSVLGLITWAWVTPLSYIVGGIRKTCSAMASSRKS